MSCFGCCGEENIHQATDMGRPFPTHHAAGNIVFGNCCLLFLLLDLAPYTVDHHGYC